MLMGISITLSCLFYKKNPFPLVLSIELLRKEKEKKMYRLANEKFMLYPLCDYNMMRL